MLRFALWLCDPATTGTHISQQRLQPPVLGSTIEANWLWNFLQRVEDGQLLLNRAQTVAAMSSAQKTALRTWIQTVSSLATQFQAALPQTQWPVNCPLTSKSDWQAFKTLMEAFYEKGFRSDLPYQPDGTPTAANGVKYADYVEAFRNAHRLNRAPDAREVCVLCGGPLGDTPHVDHWIIKSKFPLLSVCAENLALICSTCNEAPNKGDKPVHSRGSFADWFHPYLRPGNRAVRLNYVLTSMSVECTATIPVDQPKSANLDALLNLSARWTREFKAEYVKHQDVLKRRELRKIQNSQVRHSLADLQNYIDDWQADLVPSEPHHEVHQTLCRALQQAPRLAAWLRELELVT
jgi:hypothetical protein